MEEILEKVKQVIQSLDSVSNVKVTYEPYSVLENVCYFNYKGNNYILGLGIDESEDD